MEIRNTSSGGVQLPKPEELALTLVVKRPLLNDLRSPEKSIKIENLFEDDSPGSSGGISYDNPALDLSVEFLAHENISGTLQFVISSGGSSVEPVAENRIVLKATDNQPGLLIAQSGSLQKLTLDSGAKALAVFNGESPAPQPFLTSSGTAILSVRDGELHWGGIMTTAGEEQQ